MNTKDLRSFQAVYEERSISKAAQKLFITPQGLGKNIRALEQDLHTALFERTSHGVEPTESAHLLYEQAGELIHRLETLDYSISQLKQQKILLRIGYACGVFNVLPFDLIQQFMKENDQIRVEYCEYFNEEVKALLRDSRLEYGLIVGDWIEEKIERRKLGEEDIFLLIYEEHRLYERDRVSVRDLDGENLLLMNEHFHMYHDFARLCQLNDVHPRIVAKTAESGFLYKLARLKAGLALVPGFALREYHLEHLRAVPIEEPLKWDVYGVYKKDNRHYETIARFDAFVRKHLYH